MVTDGKPWTTSHESAHIFPHRQERIRAPSITEHARSSLISNAAAEMKNSLALDGGVTD